MAMRNHLKFTLWSKCLENPPRGLLEMNTWAKKDFKELCVRIFSSVWDSLVPAGGGQSLS